MCESCRRWEDDKHGIKATVDTEEKVGVPLSLAPDHPSWTGHTGTFHFSLLPPIQDLPCHSTKADGQTQNHR